MLKKDIEVEQVWISKQFLRWNLSSYITECQSSEKFEIIIGKTSTHRAENIFLKYLLHNVHEIAWKCPREKKRYSSFSDSASNFRLQGKTVGIRKKIISIRLCGTVVKCSLFYAEIASSNPFESTVKTVFYFNSVNCFLWVSLSACYACLPCQSAMPDCRACLPCRLPCLPAVPACCAWRYACLQCLCTVPAILSVSVSNLHK
jgi:hypothetical protein